MSKICKEFTFCYLNFRPIDLPKKVKSILLELYKQYNPSGQVCIVLNILAKDGHFDINVSPDKREVFLKNEAAVISGLHASLV